MTRQAKTKATPTTMPSNFQNKCCSRRAERQLLNSFLLDELHVIFSTYPVEPHSGVVLIWKLEHGVHSSVTTNSSTNQHGEVEVLTDSFSSRTGASASQSFKVKAHSNQQRWPPRGRPCLPAPTSMERSGSHLLQQSSLRLQQTSLRFQLRAAKCQSSQSGPTRAVLERPRDHGENNPCRCLG